MPLWKMKLSSRHCIGRSYKWLSYRWEIIHLTILLVMKGWKCEALDEFLARLACRALWEFYRRKRSGWDVRIHRGDSDMARKTCGGECLGWVPLWEAHLLLLVLRAPFFSFWVICSAIFQLLGDLSVTHRSVKNHHQCIPFVDNRYS